MKVAIMQPYIFPYIGYFQLVQSVDHFIFYDDVNFIKQGWINRNRVLVNGKETLFTIPLKKASSFELINQTLIHPILYKKWRKKFLKTVEQSYGKAPYFQEIYTIIQKVINIEDKKSISEIATQSISEIIEYLQMNKKFYISSKHFPQATKLDRADRIIAITKILEAKEYINMPGGKKLYNKSYFRENGLKLNFIAPKITGYDQYIHDFVPGLSIIDVLMFNSKQQVGELLNQFELE